MGKLTAQQVNELANHFLEMAEALETYREQNFAAISGRHNKEIKDLHHLILQFGDDYYTLSAILVLDDVHSSLTLIRELKIKMQNTFQTLQDVQKAINIAGSVVTLGNAIVNIDLKAIAEALINLKNTISS